jgi:hypothetical protein
VDPKKSYWRVFGLPGLILLSITLFCAVVEGQPQAARSSGKSPAPALADNTPATNDENLAATRRQLLELLQMSPKLSSFIARDPSLLAEQDYISRNNPELAKFLEAHPQIARNPEFYLFADLGNDVPRFHSESGWRESRNPASEEIVRDVVPFLVFLVILGALLWLLRVVLENLRWRKTFHVQSDVYNKLLDKFSTNEELLSYVRTEAGQRFLESSLTPLMRIEPPRAIGSPLARVFTPLQLGLPLTLVGGGLLYLRDTVPEGAAPLSVFGMLALMLGIGFIISAGVALLLARHMGMLPPAGHLQNGAKQDAGDQL